MSSTSYFFGYGANRSIDRVAKLLGKDPQGGFGAIAEGYDLAIQTLDQIPEKAQEILHKVWGNTFKAYTLIPGKGVVAGTIWKIDEEDFKTIYNFEFVDLWSKFEVIKVKKFNGTLIEAVTTRVPDDSPISEIADGINYINNLNGTLIGERKSVEAKKEDDEFKISAIAKITSELKHLAPLKK